MRTFIGVCLVLLSVIFYSCNNQNSSPTAPQYRNPGVSFSIAGYGASLDSSYYKVWSDSSWEEFYKDTTISGTPYNIILYSSGGENLYGPNGYSGFGVAGDSGYVVLFDSVLASPPDTMVEGTSYLAQTTFTYGGSSYVLQDQETLIDTTSVTTPVGTFSNCRVIQSVGAIGSVVQYSTIYWYAKGPSDIVQQDYTGYTVMMAYGTVNGQYWGQSLSKEMAGLPPLGSGMIGTAQKITSGTAKSAEDIRSIAPLILRGITRH